MRRTAATVFALLLAPVVALADPLDDLLAEGRGSSCFERVYDKSHLAKAPRQKTRTALLSLERSSGAGSVTFRLRFERSDGTLYLVGDCSWQATANLDVMGEPLIPAFKGPSGLDCHALTSEDGMSAEEGGDFPVDLRDGKAVVLYVPEDLAAWRSLDRSRAAEFVSFGRDDAVFRLDRTDPGTCQGLVTSLKALD